MFRLSVLSKTGCNQNLEEEKWKDSNILYSWRNCSADIYYVIIESWTFKRYYVLYLRITIFQYSECGFKSTILLNNTNRKISKKKNTEWAKSRMENIKERKIPKIKMKDVQKWKAIKPVYSSSVEEILFRPFAIFRPARMQQDRWNILCNSHTNNKTRESDFPWV